MFPKVHLRIIPTLGKWILLAPKPIKINGKRGSLFYQKNLLTNLRGEFYSIRFEERGPRVPDKYQLRVGCILDPRQGSMASILLGVALGSPRKIYYTGFLTQIGHSILNHKTYHPGNTTRLYGAQNSIQKLEPCSGYKQFCAC